MDKRDNVEEEEEDVDGDQDENEDETESSQSYYRQFHNQLDQHGKAPLLSFGLSRFTATAIGF